MGVLKKKIHHSINEIQPQTQRTVKAIFPIFYVHDIWDKEYIHLRDI